MRFSFLLALALFATGSASAAIRVVSDIDDTVKITNVGSTWPSVWNGLLTARAFTGMSELYRSLAMERGYVFEYLSASPTVLAPRVRRFLRLNDFPEGNLTLKPLTGAGETREYKIRALHALLEKHPEDKFIFIGDDTQADVAAYDELFRFAPDRILGIYIRKVVNEQLPPSIYPFLTAFEIARTEFLMGRLTVDQASPVALAVLGERKEKRIFPGFAYCPSPKSYLFHDDRMEEWNLAIEARTHAICRKRNLPWD